MRVREPRKSRPPPGSGGGKPSNAAARQLTIQMKEARSAAELLDILDEEVDGPIFNYFHASAACHGLATWKRKGGLTPSDKTSPVLPRLAARVQDISLKGQLEPRQVSNVFWSLGKLCDVVEVPKGLLMALVESMSEKARGMKPQELSNSLLAFVELKGVAPEVLTALPELAAQTSIKAQDMKPQELSNSLWASAHFKDDAFRRDVAKIVAALACQIPVKSKDMVPQALSNSLWAATRLKDDAPEVLQMVPAVVEEIPGKQTDFTSQAICNCLEALILLQDSVPEVGSFLAAPPNSKNDFVGFAASRFSTLLPTLKGKSLALQMPVMVWACAKVNFYHEELLLSVAQCAKSDGTLQTLTDWSLCAMLWSYDVLDPDARFAEFKTALESEIVRRRLSDSDVSKSQSGYFDWNQAKG